MIWWLIMDNERYVMQMEFYIYAPNDEKAKSLANYVAERQKMKFDNRCGVSSLKRAPFGSLVDGEELIAK